MTFNRTRRTIAAIAMGAALGFTLQVNSASADEALIEAGAKVYKKCKACHMVGEGAKNRVGPELNNVIGRPAGGLEGYSYSKGMQAKAEEGLVWDEETLNAFMESPRKYVPKTKMAFPGLRKEKDREAIIAYLKSFSE